MSILSKYRVFSGPYFPVFSPNTGKFSPNTGKYGPEKAPYLDTFHAVGERVSKDFRLLSLINYGYNLFIFFSFHQCFRKWSALYMVGII